MPQFSLSQRLLHEMEIMIPAYLLNPLDAFNHGNLAACIMDENGMVCGKIWGDNKLTGRGLYKNAWVKASQVWITGINTGEYEQRLFNGEFEEERFGIIKPDLIGWLGGQSFTLKDGTIISVGVSGLRGISDLEIASRAVAIVESNNR